MNCKGVPNIENFNVSLVSIQWVFVLKEFHEHVRMWLIAFIGSVLQKLFKETTRFLFSLFSFSSTISMLEPITRKKYPYYPTKTSKNVL